MATSLCRLSGLARVSVRVPRGLNRKGMAGLLPVDDALIMAHQVMTTPVRQSVTRKFRLRTGNAEWYREKDVFHFYVITPFLILGAITYTIYIICGPCELVPEPEEGPPPRFWEYERTVVRQFCSRYFAPNSDVMRHEQMFGRYHTAAEINKQRYVMDRVLRLIWDRGDYNAVHYQSGKNFWRQRTKWMSQMFEDNHEAFRHNPDNW